MKNFSVILMTGFMFLVIASTEHSAFAGSEQFDTEMQPVLEAYLKIADQLDSDKTDGVKDAAKKIEGLAGGISSASVTGEHAAHYASIPKKISAAAKRMTLAADIESIRAAFSDLSKPMVMWASMSKPSGINVIYCSMKLGSWLQKGAEIHNPYYGAAMPTCGEIISGPGAKK